MNEDLIAALRKVPLFADLRARTLEDLAARCRRRRFPAREALFHEGDPGDVLYVILSGSVDVQRDNAVGDTVHLARRGPGETVGEMAILDGALRSADAATAEPTELLMLYRDGFRQALAADPNLALELLASLAGRLREATEQTVRRTSQDAMGRLAELLLQEAEARGETVRRGEIRLTARMSHSEMAERIGAKRETVTRALSRLRSLGAVRAGEDGALVVITERLRQYAGA